MGSGRLEMQHDELAELACPLTNMELTYTVRFGKDTGSTLTPHRSKRGFVASKNKEGPHEYVQSEEQLIPYLQRGWSIRMSAPGHAPSLICPDSVDGWRHA
jgi:hypothetical protein